MTLPGWWSGDLGARASSVWPVRSTHGNVGLSWGARADLSASCRRLADSRLAPGGCWDRAAVFDPSRFCLRSVALVVRGVCPVALLETDQVETGGS